MSEAEYWQAIVNKNKQQDGTFVYAKQSTKIYCRPSCPSRLPRREQVVFFGQPAEAEQAGYRACLRCHPKEVNPQLEIARQVCDYIEANVDSAPSLETLGAKLNFSPQHLQRVFKKVMGVSPHQYLEACRLNRLKTRLKEGDNVSTALYEAGYGSSSRLYAQAPVQLGMTPATYRKGGNGLAISYTVVDSPLGFLLIAATVQGICFVSLADEVSSLETALHKEYPRATFTRDDLSLHQWAEQVLNHLKGRQPDIDLPVAVAYTPFQAKVWQELRNIPLGSTRSYRKIAEAVGQPTAARAVARVCATNPVALIIPCHRVVRENGDLGGYRWGLERKRQLLQQEHDSVQSALALVR